MQPHARVTRVLGSIGVLLSLSGVVLVGMMAACADQSPTSSSTRHGVRTMAPNGRSLDYDPAQLPESSAVTPGPTQITTASTQIVSVSNAGRSIRVATVCDYCTLAKYEHHVQ